MALARQPSAAPACDDAMEAVALRHADRVNHLVLGEDVGDLDLRSLFMEGILGCFFKDSVKTAVPGDGKPPGALVLTKLIEWYRFGVGREKSFL